MNDQINPPFEHTPPDEILDQAIGAMRREKAPTGPSAELIAATVRALDESGAETYRTLPFIPRSRIMKVLSVAAAVFLIIGAATLFPHSRQSGASAFAQAIEQVRAARSMSYTQIMTAAGDAQVVRTREFIAADGRRRSEQGGIGAAGGIATVFDTNGYIRIVLLEMTKTALQYEARSDRKYNAGQGFVTWLDTLRKLGDKPDRELGQKDFAGRPANGFVVTQGNRTFTMWVDQATSKPVQIENDAEVAGKMRHVTLTDFRFDESVDESLFSFEIPPGYTNRRAPAVPAVPGGEASVIEALRGYTQKSGGKFPAGLTDWGTWAVLFAKDSVDGSLDADTTRVMAHLGAALPFLSALPKADHKYLGEGKTVDQKEAIIFWYKKPEGTYRAIYGDFSAKDVSADEVTKQ